MPPIQRSKLSAAGYDPILRAKGQTYGREDGPRSTDDVESAAVIQAPPKEQHSIANGLIWPVLRKPISEPLVSCYYVTIRVLQHSPIPSAMAHDGAFPGSI